jgi:hypothetical protein
MPPRFGVSSAKVGVAMPSRTSPAANPRFNRIVFLPVAGVVVPVGYLSSQIVARS